MRALFDPKCLELANHFLADIPNITDDDRMQLARDLQETAEDFCQDMECCPICSACPGFTGAECDETCPHAKANPAA